MVDLVYILAADEAYPPRLDLLVETHISKLRMRFESALWVGSSFVDAAMAGEAIEAYQSLSETARLHLFLSPAFFAAVNDMSEPTVEHFAVLTGLVRDEAAVHAQRRFGQTGDEIWSPLGDAVFRPGSTDCPVTYSEKIDSLITIDFDSPYGRAYSVTSAIMSLPLEDYTAEERAVVVAKLNDSFAHLASISSTYARLVRNFTRVIIPRQSSIRQNFAAEHVTRTTGEMHLLNMHNPVLSFHRLADNLLHETVHNLLSSYEFVEGPFVLVNEAKQYRPVSPWTGNPIPIPSFCHAVFVWFALFRYATLELATLEPGSMREEEVRLRLNKAAAGFVIPVPLSSYLRGLNEYSSGLLQVFDWMQDAVHKDYRTMRSDLAPMAMSA